MHEKIFVISDLHLGGGEGFQMCSANGRELLTDFIGWVTKQHTASTDVHLVIAGDSIDMLAERDPDGGYSAFTEDEMCALGKLNRILDSSALIWKALGELLRAGARLTLMSGNHDVEMSYPALRSRLARVIGGGKFEFIYDNEAFSEGSFLVEHGNRYDGFNQVDYDGLRRIRSHLSRREATDGDIAIQPGSELVARVMNRIKETYPFVDLLKPETSGVVPILAALDGKIWAKAGPVIKTAAKAWARGRADGEGIPNRKEFIAACSVGTPYDVSTPLPDQDLFELADSLSNEDAGSESVAWFDELKIDLLLRAFRKRREKESNTFAVDREAKGYLVPATAAARRGFNVVVMGHTHLAKQVPLDGGGLYLNTGTWADLMCIPDSVHEGSREEGRVALQAFLEDIKSNNISRYRRPVPTFALLEKGLGGGVGQVLFYDGDGKVEPVSTGGLLSRLGVEN